MQVIGFNFIKVNAERFLDVKEASTERKVNSNIEFLDIEKDKINLMDLEVLKITFKFSITYEPKIGELNFEGILLLKSDEEKIKETLKDWKKKKISDDMKIPLLNLILNKCTLRSLQLEEELGLPTHINLPRLQKGQQQNS